MIQLTSTMFTVDGTEGRRQVRDFTVGSGSETTDIDCTVPRLVGLSIDQARQQADAAKLILDERVVEAGGASGLVLTQDPPEGSPVECGSMITVSFSGVA